MPAESVVEGTVGDGTVVVRTDDRPRTIPLGRVPLPPADKPIETYTTKEIGAEGEQMAADYLEGAGYEILARNWRYPFGEIDILARDDDPRVVVLVEVKTRVVLGGDADLVPELSVDRRKRDRYRYMALRYISEHPEYDTVRFDVIAINLTGHCRGRLRHLRGAYSWDEN